MKALKIVTAVVVLASMFALGWWVSPSGSGEPTAMRSPGGAAEKTTEWICPMHPQIRQPEFGTCPICGMDLVEDSGSQGDVGPRQLAMSQDDQALLEIDTALVERRFVTKEIRLVGKVDYDETRVRTISAWVPGRLERLFVDYTGVPVRAGEHLVLLYSPEVYQAQTELLQAKQRLAELKPETSQFLADSNRDAYASAREKLRRWGLTAEQIDGIETRGTAEDTVLITSPISGIVIHKALNQGDYVQTGQRVYQVAELDRLWIRLDAYEQDLSWLHYGQAVAIETEAVPGEVFPGFVSFLGWDVSARTRTIDVRVNVDNADGKLKPGMFVRAVVESRLAEAGRVVDPRLQGKWICPMHPEVIQDDPGACRVCGMALEPAESVGHVAALPTDPPLLVPATAPMITGKRAVVYVQVPGKDRPTYEGREVVLGPRAGDHYLVRAGLKEGERVVVRGAFKIDSALQIQAKPSMMGMAGEGEFSGSRHAVFRASLRPLLQAYLRAQVALAADDDAAARQALTEMAAALGQVRDAELVLRARRLWEEEHANLHAAFLLTENAEDIEGLRNSFDEISNSALRLLRAFGHAGVDVLYQVHCPMAFDDRGADWVQADDVVANPYFGASMLRCGTVERMYAGDASDRPVPQDQPRQAESQPTQQPEREMDPPVEQRAADPPAQPEQASLGAGVFQPLYAAYLQGHEALADDDGDAAAAAFGRLAKAAGGLRNRDPLPGGEATGKLLAAVEKTANAASRGDLAAVRVAFEPLSSAMLAVHDAHGHTGTELWAEAFCPMAFDNRGAAWLQRGETILNPYFGSSMLRCGSVRRKLPGGR